MESPDDHATLPCGTTLPASPENRAHARKLWATDNNSLDNVDNELKTEEQRVRVLEEHLRAQRDEFERALENEHEQRAQEQERHEQEQRALEQQYEDQRAQGRAHEQEREQARQREIDQLNMRLHYEEQIGAIRERLQQEMEKTNTIARCAQVMLMHMRQRNVDGRGCRQLSTVCL